MPFERVFSYKPAVTDFACEGCLSMDRVCVSSHFRSSREAHNGPGTFCVGAFAASVMRMRVEVGGKVDHGFELDGGALLSAVATHVGSFLDGVCHGPNVGVFFELVDQRGNGAVFVEKVGAFFSGRRRHVRGLRGFFREHVIGDGCAFNRRECQRAPVQVRRGDGHVSQTVVLFGIFSLWRICRIKVEVG